MSSTGVDVGICMPATLGDAIIYCVIVNNLCKAGYQVTVYHNLLYDLRGWHQNASFKPRLSPAQVVESVERHDVVVMLDDHCGFNDEEKKYYFPKMVVFSMRRVSARDQYDVKPYLEGRYGNTGQYDAVMRLATIDNQGLYTKNKTESMVERGVNTCRHYLGFNNVDPEVSWNMPATLVRAKHSKRVVLHPLSGSQAKNWYLSRFIKLAKKLKKLGWQPVFMVAPHEYDSFKAQLGGEFSLPKFGSLLASAEFLYESAAVIGNDSGVGHLASSMNVPVLTLYCRNKAFAWRPGWGALLLCCAAL